MTIHYRTRDGQAKTARVTTNGLDMMISLLTRSGNTIMRVEA